MTRVVRLDTGETVAEHLGDEAHLASILGRSLPFKVWMHADGTLQKEPPDPQPGQRHTPRPLRIEFTVRTGTDGRVELAMRADQVYLIQAH